MRKAPDAIDRHVGARIRLRRNMLGVSQEKLAEGLGLTFQQVQKYEKGTNRISASKLWLIARFLQVDLSYFFEGLPTDGSAPEAASTPDGASPTRYSLEISSRVVGLPVAQQKLVLELVRSMAGSAGES